MTTIPAAVEISSAGICATRPSPMVSRVYVRAAAATSMPRWTIPITRPPTMLTASTTMPATASPLTNFIAPSIEPKNCDSRASVARRRRASAASMWPARRSASIAICLPGIASSVKRAATSATRSEPFEITMNCTSVRITKITAPTTRLPATTKPPKAWITSPALAFSRISRVDDTSSASRNNVVSSSSVGKVAIFSASPT